MAIAPKPRAEVEAAWRDHLRSEAKVPETRNVAPVLYLTDPVRVPFRGLMYEIPPVPYTVGLQAVEMQSEIMRAVEANDFAAYKVILGDLIKLIRKNVKPYRVRTWYRFWWAMGWNPFRQASEVELGEFLAGFLMRRTMPRG
jgi:hypothetical protein